jgi:DNA segregation ATPase FtsK/SpoIIIE, S-DNA-T family
MQPLHNPLLPKALDLILQHTPSTSMLQRNLNINYQQSLELIQSLEKLNIISEFLGSKPRNILMSPDQARKTLQTHLQTQQP